MIKLPDELRTELLQIARTSISSDDPAHDFSHSYRVLMLAEKIAAIEGADFAVIVPAALFHDLVNHPKDSPLAQFSAQESADAASSMLSNIDHYPKDRIARVHAAIRCHSFGSSLAPDFLEARIIQDADALEATGAIAIMRTFASTGIMKRPFYHPDDPFASARDLDDRRYAVDLFFTRLLKVSDHLHTASAKEMALRRCQFLADFLSELKLELNGR
jgi:uncharacterized protein